MSDNNHDIGLSSSAPGVELASAAGHRLPFYYPYIVKTAQEGIWIYDPEGKTLFANECMASLLDTSLEALLTRRISDFQYEEDCQENSSSKSNGRSANEPIECRYRKTGGRECWTSVRYSPIVDPAGRLLGTVAMHIDITEKRVAQHALRQSRENMGRIINNVKDFAIITLDANRRVLSWNTGATAIFGYSEAEMIGASADLLFTDEDILDEVPEKELANAMKLGHSYDDRWHKRKDGSAFYASGVLTRLGSDNQPARFIKIARDWTDRKQVEEMLQKADRHKNEFLATLAHELRNPLASILSSVEVLKQETGADGIAKIRQVMERQVQQMIHLVNDLLDISRISTGKINIVKQPINLVDSIHMALDTSRMIVEGYKHALTVSLPAGALIVDADLSRLSQVFLNILINAAKYTPPRGNITLTVKREGDMVVTRVKDDGIGIPPEMLSTIFEMFQQVQDRSEYPQAGLGIGLSVVKELVNMHGGQVQAFSEGVNKGSEFVVSLPLVTDQEQPLPARTGEASAPLAAAATISRGNKILLIDDNADAVDMMEMMLRKQGFTVAKAYDGQTGVDQALAFGPDVVVLDLGLPDMDGYEVLQVLRKQPGDRRYLALSGWGQEEDLRKSKEAGFDHHLVKPIDLGSLLRILGEKN